MKKYYRFALVISSILLLSIAAGCGHSQIKGLPEDFMPTCIQGTVWYRMSTDPTPVPYPYARITAWRHGTDQPLSETKADEAGNYCVEVPLGESGVDLRVWGVKRLRGTGYTCKGSENNIDAGTASKRCGEDCVKIDIITDCEEFQPPYYRQI